VFPDNLSFKTLCISNLRRNKVSLFSGLNNLEDITISPDFSAICGYTQDELEGVFSGWIDDDVDLAEVKNWYNGYNWLGQEVYNPFDILLYLKQRDFRNFWFKTGTLAFLIKLLRTALVPLNR